MPISTSLRATLASGLVAATLPLAASAGTHAQSLRSFSLLQQRAGIETALQPGEDVLDEQFLKDTLGFLAADDKLGRKPGSPQLEGAVFDFMIEKLTAWGLQPAGNPEGTSFKQAFKASSWWPLQGLAAPAILEHSDEGLFCGEPNQHGFAISPSGDPITVEPLQVLHRAGRAVFDDQLRRETLAASYDTHNICAMVPGSDPALADEVVVLGAHIDHVGHRGATIYNGADDNGSGSSILLNIAKAFATLRANGQGPKRSVLFLWFSAEEMGLLGSQYWVKQPTIEVTRIKAMLNMDMLGRTESDEISVYDGFSEDRGWEFHDWHDLDSLGFAGVDHNLKGFLRRSDQYPFYRKGIPVMFFFEGFVGSSNSQMNPDYHQPGDTPDKIDYSKLRRSAGFIYRHALRASWDTLPATHSGQ